MKPEPKIDLDSPPKTAERTSEIIRLPEVCRITGLGGTTIYYKTREGKPGYDPEFPVPVPLARRSIGWYRHEVEAWVASRRKPQENAAPSPASQDAHAASISRLCAR